MPGAPPCWVGCVGGTNDIALSLTVTAECPDQRPELQPWNPGHDRDHRVYIGRGRALLLSSSATVHSIHISEGGKPASPLEPQVECRSPSLEMDRAQVTCFGFPSEYLVV